MTLISYASKGLLEEIDTLKQMAERESERAVLRIHNQRKAALEHEALNTSLYIEYPEMRKIVPGRMDREARKLLGRLNTAWVYCRDNVDRTQGISIRDLEVIQGIIVDTGELGMRKGDVVFNVPHEIPAPSYALVPSLMDGLFTNLRRLKEIVHPVEYATYLLTFTSAIHSSFYGWEWENYPACTKFPVGGKWLCPSRYRATRTLGIFFFA